MKRVVIGRKRWMRNKPNNIMLWNIKLNQGCCLGHACKQISGKTEKQLNRKKRPVRGFKTPIVSYGL